MKSGSHHPFLWFGVIRVLKKFLILVLDVVFYPKLQGGNDSGGLACHVIAEPVSRARWRESDKVYTSTGGMLSSRSTQMTHSGKRDQAVKLPIHVL